MVCGAFGTATNGGSPRGARIALVNTAPLFRGYMGVEPARGVAPVLLTSGTVVGSAEDDADTLGRGRATESEEPSDDQQVTRV